jgi:hypothetical protein
VTPLVYLAGPVTKPEPMVNVNRAVRVATELRDSGLVVPFVPHLTCMWHMIEPADYETWMNYDLEIIPHCDGLYRMSGESSGADREVQLAHSLNLPVFFDDMTTLMQWAETRRPH